MSSYKEKYNEIKIPSGIARRIENGKKKGKRNRYFRKIAPLASVASIFIVAILFLNTSIVFATSVSEVPIVGDFAKILIVNPAIKYALDEGYVQKINMVKEKDGVKVTLTRVIGDNRKLIFGLTVDGIKEEDSEYYFPKLIEILDEKRMPLGSYTISWGQGDYSEQGLKPLKGEKYFEVDLVGTNKLPNKFSVRFIDIINMNKYGEDIKVKGEFNFNIQLNEKILKVEPEVYPIDKTVNFNEGNLLIKEMEIYPMVTDLIISVDISETQKFTWIKDGYLINDKGEKFALISGGGLEDKGEYRLTFNGGIFKKHDSLTLNTQGMYYQSKDNKIISVDLKNKVLIEDGGCGIQLVSIENVKGIEENQMIKGDGIRITFKEKEGSKIEGISLNYKEDVDNNIGYISSIYNREVGELNSFGVEIGNSNISSDIVNFEVYSIHKDITKPFSVKIN